MNRQDIRAGHYSEPRGRHTISRPFHVLVRDALARLILGDLRGGTA
ncbi:hypothetical protein [Nocardioides sp. SYSU DS0651]